MFGGGGGGPPPPKKRPAKGPAKVMEIPVSLHQFYHGHQVEMKMTRQVFCKICKGDGATEKENCGPCGGHGKVRQHIQMGPITMINEGPCGHCHGRGWKLKGKCIGCEGRGTTPEEMTLTLKIDPGSKAGDVLKFAGAASDSPDYEERSDVHIRLDDVEEKSGWVRQSRPKPDGRGDDLHYTLHLGLTESLTGAQPVLIGHPKYEGGFDLRVDEVVIGGDIIRLEGAGMPGPNGSFDTCGDGIIHIRVRGSIVERTQWWMQPPTSKHEWVDETISKRPVLKGRVMLIGGIGSAEV